MKIFAGSTLTLIVLLAFTGCTLPSYLPQADNIQPSGSHVVIIGKIELLPPLEPDLEQDTYWNIIGDSRILNNVMIATGSKKQPVVAGTNRSRDWQSTIEATWGQPFMVKAKRQRTWINGALTTLDLRNGDKLWFPGGFYFDIPADANAVYIGTISYQRDVYNSIIDLQIINEFESTIELLKLAEKKNQVHPVDLIFD